MDKPRTPDVSVYFESLEELADATAQYVGEGDNQYKGWSEYFNGAPTVQDVIKLARHGWTESLPSTMELVDSAIETVETEFEMSSFSTYHDVAGSMVDIGRYLSGEPECMLEFAPLPTPAAGRVITLCASVSVSGAISADTLKRRGAAIAALAFALERLGFNTELYADDSSEGGSYKGHTALAQTRVLIKGANDYLDPAKVMFGYAHPGMLRGLLIPIMHSYPKALHRAMGVGSGYGSPTPPIEDLPEGTIYLPSVRSSYDVPNADEMLRKHLTALGIVPALS